MLYVYDKKYIILIVNNKYGSLIILTGLKRANEIQVVAFKLFGFLCASLQLSCEWFSRLLFGFFVNIIMNGLY